MKTNFLKLTAIMLLLTGSLISCEKETEFDTIPYEKCTHEGAGEYMDTVLIEGTGYLFLNSIPAELQKQNNAIYIIHNPEDNSATFTGTYPAQAFYSGRICNFPDFAKEWEIPFEGRKIYYKGDLYVTGIYASAPPHIGGDLILTTFK